MILWITISPCCSQLHQPFEDSLWCHIENAPNTTKTWRNFGAKGSFYGSGIHGLLGHAWNWISWGDSTPWSTEVELYPFQSKSCQASLDCFNPYPPSGIPAQAVQNSRGGAGEQLPFPWGLAPSHPLHDTRAPA